MGKLFAHFGECEESTNKYLSFSSQNDSYPREKNQGVEFEKAIAPVDLIISLECGAETMVERILQRAAKSVEKRADDNEETIKNRIATFIQNTDEILNQYPTQTRRVIAHFSLNVRSQHFASHSCIFFSYFAQ